MPPSQTNSPRPLTKAVVLGGGGPVGRAWEMGLATDLLAHGIDLGGADLIIGTSAGAIVGAQIAIGLDDGRNVPVVNLHSTPTASPASASAMQQVMAGCARAATSSTPYVEYQQMGRLALAADTMSEEESLARPVLKAFAGQQWPSNFCATSVNTRTGHFQAWNTASEIPLEQAVAASSALPGAWPPITIGEDRYMDGGVRSMLNSRLAAGYANVVVVSCFALSAPQNCSDAPSMLNRALVDEIETLRRGGSAVEVVAPDEVFLALTKNGSMMLNTALVPDAFEAGKRQALGEVERIRRIWAI